MSAEPAAIPPPEPTGPEQPQAQPEAGATAAPEATAGAATPPPQRPQDSLSRELRIGGIIAAAFFVIFLGWAAFAPLDAGAYAVGKIVVSGNRQAVQHRDGGVVSALHVREGDTVQRGAVLVEISAGELRATERGRDIPILAMTANAFAEERQRCLDVGMNAHVAKPVVAEQLFSTLQTWLARGRPTT